MRYPATYYDGITAEARSVVVAVGDMGITISAPGGGVLAAWPAERVVLAELPRDGEPVRLGLDGTTARLIVDDPGVVETLRPLARRLHRSVRPSWPVFFRFAGWTAAAVGSVAVLLLFVVPSLSKQLAAITPDVVRHSIGDTALKQIPLVFEIDTSGPPGTREAFCSDAPGREALEAMVARLTADMAEPPALRLVVFNSAMVNAFALPGGIVALTKGFIDHASSAEEVAGVIAHEIGHVHHDHSIQAMYQTTAVSMLVGILTGDFTGGVLITGVAEWVLNSGYSRTDERAADRYALERLYAAGIDASGLEGFFARLLAREAEGDGTLASILSTHPLTRERIEAVRNAPRASGTVFGRDHRQWRRLRAICGTTQENPPGIAVR